ncbi:MAG: hypothetical protein HFJ12_03105 [Bacilli bacterium]|nr:hypothetical protein [Bacilli bacterium]
MNLDQYLDEDLLIVCPNAIKIRILNQYCDQLISFKFMTKEDFKKHYYFSYDNQAIVYLMEKYHYHIDVAKTYLENLYVIDTSKNYQSDKLRLLKKIKKELIMNSLLEFDPLFSKYLATKKIIVIGYNVLEKYEEDMLKKATRIQKDIKKLDTKVFSCHTIEDEILFVIENILELVKKKVKLNQIYIANLSDDYLYSIKKLFSYFNIPIQLDMRESIYGTKIVKEYLESKKMPAFQTKIGIKLVEIVNRLVEVEDSKVYKELLIDQLKHTYLSPKYLTEEVHIINIEEEMVEDTDYLFVIGFNQDYIPKIYKNEEFITDQIKKEVALYPTKEKNRRSREGLLRQLSNVKNLYLSYKESSNFNHYLPSSLIKELELEVVPYQSNKLYPSNFYNRLSLANLLDRYHKYGEETPYLRNLLKHYKSNNHTYNNQFTGINSANMLESMNHVLRLSYTSLNTYYLCSFRYYVSYILKLDPYQDTFSIVIGNLFHFIFSVMYDDYFNFDREWNHYISSQDLSPKEQFLLKNLKARLEEVIIKIKDLEMLSSYRNVLTEQEITIQLQKNIDVFFTGKIDKIMYKRESDDTYFSIIDYKTGNVHSNLFDMKYGINMQLPIYLYLLSKSKLFSSPIFTGMYFQKVLYKTLKWEPNKELEDMKKSNLKLQGYSTDVIDRIFLFDRSYENSEWIRGIKINKDGSFSKNSKIISDEEVYDMLKYTEKMIQKGVDHILKGDFQINPKIIDKEKACEYCKFKDLCFVNPKDYIYLDKMDNLEFLKEETEND